MYQPIFKSVTGYNLTVICPWGWLCLCATQQAFSRNCATVSLSPEKNRLSTQSFSFSHCQVIDA
jgi:hypothetical protein